MVALLCYCWHTAVRVLVLFLKVWWVDLWSVIVAVPGLPFHSQLLLSIYLIEAPFNTFANRADPDQAALIGANRADPDQAALI